MVYTWPEEEMYGIAFVVVAWRGAFFFAIHTACTFTRGKAYVAGFEALPG